tara:strand:- start:63715 stop:64698 length:984 start_codon:yes stop_codon:yes gene_type:complete
MNERDKLINKLIKEKGGTREQYLQLLNEIAYHESAHTMDPTLWQYARKDGRQGPGRGVFQFEEGAEQGGITAARRTKEYYKELGYDIPKWLEDANSTNSLDASKLTREQQDTLFLGNMKGHPTADFANVWSGEQSNAEFWASYHWAGSEKDKVARLKSYAKSQSMYIDAVANNTVPVWDPQKIEPVVPASSTTIAHGKTTVENDGLFAPMVPAAPAVAKVEAPTKIKQPSRHQRVADDVAESPAIGSYEPFSQTTGVNYDEPKAMGGSLGLTSYADKEVNHFGNGGTHEMNPYGGIPMGNGNTVEEDETSYNLKSGKFIFSNRITYE